MSSRGVEGLAGGRIPPPSAELNREMWLVWKELARVRIGEEDNEEASDLVGVEDSEEAAEMLREEHVEEGVLASSPHRSTL